MQAEDGKIIPAEITYKNMRELFAKKRRREAHKGDFGRVLIIAGSRGMAGAAILCGRGALRAGAGLTTFFVPDELLPIVQCAVPEAMCLCANATTPSAAASSVENGAFSATASSSDLVSTMPLSANLLASYDAIAVGPGLGTEEEAQRVVSCVLDNYKGKLVLDADALNIIAEDKVARSGGMQLRPNVTGTIITPHPGEAARLLGATVSEIQADRESAAIALAEKLGCIVVLKGAGTLVAAKNPATELYVNTTGNPGMATGGSGDVLTGVIVSFVAQGMAPLTAARAGVFIHGLAGDLAAADLGEAGLIAGDLPPYIAGALKEIAV